MSANLDLVRSIYEDWQRGDFHQLGAWVHPEVEAVLADGPSPASWKGLAGLAAGWRELRAVWDDYGAEVEEYRELDDGRVLVLFARRGRGKASGLDLGAIATRGASLYSIHGDKVIGVVNYFDCERARADLGLED
jgi:ketosteroid isomerase-like protein